MPKAVVPDLPEIETNKKLHQPRLHPSGKVVLGVIISILVICLGLTVANFARKAPKVVDSGSSIGQYANFAEQALIDWAAGRPTSLPRAQGVTPSLGRESLSTALGQNGPAAAASIHAGDISYISTSYFINNGQRIEDDMFLVTTPYGNLRVEVPVAVTPGGPVIAADPSASPVSLPNGAPVGYETQSNNPIPPNLGAQVDKWAQAYASNNSQALYDLMGGACPHSTYHGLGGWRVIGTPSVASTLPVDNGTRLVAQVNVVLQAGSRVNGPVMTIPYDLLAGDLGALYPSILAWGPTGTGPFLTACQNG